MDSSRSYLDHISIRPSDYMYSLRLVRRRAEEAPVGGGSPRLPAPPRLFELEWFRRFREFEQFCYNSAAL